MKSIREQYTLTRKHLGPLSAKIMWLEMKSNVTLSIGMMLASQQSV